MERTPPVISYSIQGACAASGLSRSSLYRLMQAHQLRFVKLGKRTLILEKDLRALIEGLGSQRPS